jgi:hypothetical protein
MKNLISAIAVCSLMSCVNKHEKSVAIGKELSSTYKYDGQQVELEGFVEVPSMVFDIDTVTVIPVDMKSTITISGNEPVAKNVVLNYGEGKQNAFFIKTKSDKYNESNCAVYDSKGQKLTLRDPVKIKGMVHYTAKGKTKRSVTGTEDQDYTYEITGVTVEKTE